MSLPPLPSDILSDCTLCPRSCHVNRLKGEYGFCGEGGVLRAARAALYTGEEPVLSGRRGSGAVFFSGCCLGCIYCQNRSISRPAAKYPRPSTESLQPAAESSQPAAGTFPSAKIQAESGRSASFPAPPAFSGRDSTILPLSPERLSDIFFELEQEGAHNINLVTPEHFVPLIIPALERAKNRGLSIPVIYNTGSYEKAETIRTLEGLIDIWLPDLKYVSSALSARHTGAADYFQYASAAIAEMVRQCPEAVFSDGSHSIDCPDDADDPLMLRGVLVRHLALPGCAEDSRAVLRYLHESYGDNIFISILNQYTPMPQVTRLYAAEAGQARTAQNARMKPSFDGTGLDGSGGLKDLCRCLSDEEYDALVDYALEIGIENGFIQEEGTRSYSFIPVFDGRGIRSRPEGPEDL